MRVILGQQLSVKAASLQAGLSERSVRKWLARFRAEGGGRSARSLFPASSKPSPDSSGASRGRSGFAALAAPRLPDRTPKRSLSRATVSRLLRRHSIARLSDLEPAAPVVRYQRQTPGELLHFDIKKLARIERPSHRVTHNRRDSSRGAGWEYVHVCIDDASRLAFAQIMPD